MRKGFLKDADIYGPEGSTECKLTEEQRQKIEENDYQHKANKKLNKMLNRGGEGELAPWYNSDFPKGCQYNSPGCVMTELMTSTYQSELHRQLLQSSARWKELRGSQDLDDISLAYCSVNDADIEEIFEHIKLNHNQTLIRLDLSCNDVMDAGIQKLVSSLVCGCAPNLLELRLFQNKFSDLGNTLLTQGLALFRKNLKIITETPAYLKTRN